MRIVLAIALLFLPGGLAAQAIQTGRWDITSTAVDLTIPGAPGFLLRTLNGKSKTERKCVSSESATLGVAALLAPDPKAQCHIDGQQIADGSYHQALTCPQKQGPSVKIVRAGTYDQTGFAGRLEMGGPTPKGPMRIVLDQRAKRVPGPC